MKIKFKWETGNKLKHFKSEKELIKELRGGGIDIENELSDDFILNESYYLGEWEYNNI